MLTRVLGRPRLLCEKRNYVGECIQNVDYGMRRSSTLTEATFIGDRKCSQKAEKMSTTKSDPNLFQSVGTGDDSWIYGYDVETKVQSS